MTHDSIFILTCDDGSVEQATAELHAATPDARILEALADGVLLVDAGLPFAALAAQWRRTPPIFVRHIAPVQVFVPLGGHAGDPDFLARTLPGKLPALETTQSFSVQARVLAEMQLTSLSISTRRWRRRLKRGIRPTTRRARTGASRLGGVRRAKRWQPDPQLLVGGAAPGKGKRLVALAGISLAADNLSNWAGGMRRFAREEGQISRAEFKLLEAIEVFGIAMPTHGVALDLGAAPGGWTRVLRRAGQYVTAIDPGDLDARLADDPGVRHRRMTAEQYLQRRPGRLRHHRQRYAHGCPRLGACDGGLCEASLSARLGADDGQTPRTGAPTGARPDLCALAPGLHHRRCAPAFPQPQRNYAFLEAEAAKRQTSPLHVIAS